MVNKRNWRKRWAWVSLVTCGSVALSGVAVAQTPAKDWPGEEMPLPLAVKTPQEIEFKKEAERQYLIFNLLAGGKFAFDGGDYAAATKKWETLLAMPDLRKEVRDVVEPLLAIARRSPGTKAGASHNAPTTPTPAQAAATAPQAARAASPAPELAVVSGTVSGGGRIGPGGAVLWLKRLDGATPMPRPGRRRVVSQKNKMFVPRVLAVPVGTTIDFRNDDDFYHNVFSLSRPGSFDTGLYASGRSYAQTFNKPGAVELLCNIHSTMQGYVYVVDTPYFTQPSSNGSFLIRRVPPGRYELTAWHETASAPVRQVIRVPAQGLTGVEVAIPVDREPTVAVPDKYGKPRQPQLGY